jgi:o-succinylbenzoate synthase
MLEFGAGRAHNIALSTFENFKRYWKEDIIDPEVEVSPQGMIAVSDEAGTGHRIREDLIKKLMVRKKRYELERDAKSHFRDDGCCYGC